MGRVIIIGGTVVVAITVAVLMSSRFDVRYAPFESTSDRAAADVLVENQRLRSRVSFLEQQNGGLAAENEALQDEVNRLEVEGAGQGNLGQELTRDGPSTIRPVANSRPKGPGRRSWTTESPTSGQPAAATQGTPDGSRSSW